MTFKNIILNPYDHENGYLMQGYVTTELWIEGKAMGMWVKGDDILETQHTLLQQTFNNNVPKPNLL